MPLVIVKLIEGRTAAQKRAAAAAITDAVADHCAVDKAHISVVFEDVSDTDWLVAGETVAERRRRRGEA